MAAVVATSERQMSSSSSSDSSGDHQNNSFVTNEDLMNEENVDASSIVTNYAVQYDQNEALTESLEDKIVEDKRSDDLGGDGLTESLKDKIVEDKRSDDLGGDGLTESLKDKIVEDKRSDDLGGDGLTESLKDKIVEDKRGDDLGRDGQTGSSSMKGGKKHIQFGIEEDESEDEEMEEVELEFENAVHKLHTHNAYCPNCDAPITKVVLRRRIPKKILTPSTTTPHPEEEKRELVGCLSCFSIFVPKGNKLDPFPIFEGANGDSSLQMQSIAKSSPEEIGCEPFAMFRGKGKTEEVNAKLPQLTKEETPLDTQEGDGGRKQAYETLPLPSVRSEDVSLYIRDVPGPYVPSNSLIPIPEMQSNSPEIVKSIVYGGLVESITSLTVVASAASSGAATLNIVALGLANLIGGLFVLIQNISNLKNEQGGEKYKEALGRKEHFPLHAIISILSYLIFGLIPPIIYGFTFQETDDKDFKLLAMAAAALICIIFLAIGKSYITQAQQPHKFSRYFNCVVYYVATAAMASGVGYLVGDKAKKFLENFGWFHYPKDQPSTTLFFHGTHTLDQSFASY